MDRTHWRQSFNENISRFLRDHCLRHRFALSLSFFRKSICHELFWKCIFWKCKNQKTNAFRFFWKLLYFKMFLKNDFQQFKNLGGNPLASNWFFLKNKLFGAQKKVLIVVCGKTLPEQTDSVSCELTGQRFVGADRTAFRGCWADSVSWMLSGQRFVGADRKAFSHKRLLKLSIAFQIICFQKKIQFEAKGFPLGF